MPVLKHYYNRKFINNQDDNLFRGIYSSFPEAEQHIPGTRPAGYDNADSAKMYKNWIGQIREHDYPVIYWLDKIKTEIDSLFDYGGHIGFLYYGYIRYLNFSEQFKWWVYDVPAVVNEGRKIAQQQGKTQLHFCDDVNPAGKVDEFKSS
jgi:putative methyltransferase (TIGR04325 family)